jgi:hypothetical protein
VVLFFIEIDDQFAFCGVEIADLSESPTAVNAVGTGLHRFQLGPGTFQFGLAIDELLDGLLVHGRLFCEKDQ